MGGSTRNKTGSERHHVAVAGGGPAMTGSFWWDLVIGLAAALLLTWLALVVALLIARPRGHLLREALRVLSDVLNDEDRRSGSGVSIGGQ